MIKNRPTLNKMIFKLPHAMPNLKSGRQVDETGAIKNAPGCPVASGANHAKPARQMPNSNRMVPKEKSFAVFILPGEAF